VPTPTSKSAYLIAESVKEGGKECSNCLRNPTMETPLSVRGHAISNRLPFAVSSPIRNAWSASEDVRILIHEKDQLDESLLPLLEYRQPR